MIKITAIQDKDVFRDIKALPAEARKEFGPIFKREGMPKINELVKATFGSDPGPVKRPIEWQTIRQQRAFFATNGFGKGIPTKRSGKVRKGWQVKLDRRSNENIIAIVNYVSYAGYVSPDVFMVGSYTQQRFHKNTGWGRNIEDWVIEVSEKVRDEAINAYVKAVDLAKSKAGL